MTLKICKLSQSLTVISCIECHTYYLTQCFLQCDPRISDLYNLGVKLKKKNRFLKRHCSLQNCVIMKHFISVNFSYLTNNTTGNSRCRLTSYTRIRAKAVSG